MQGDVEVVREILQQQGLVSGGDSGDIVRNGSRLVSIDKLASVRRCNSHQILRFIFGEAIRSYGLIFRS